MRVDSWKYFLHQFLACVSYLLAVQINNHATAHFSSPSNTSLNKIFYVVLES